MSLDARASQWEPDAEQTHVTDVGKATATGSNAPGCSLTESDFRSLEKSWITRELAEQAMLRRVGSVEGSQIVGRSDRGNYSGIVIPYVMPGRDAVRECVLRRDHPDY